MKSIFSAKPIRILLLAGILACLFVLPAESAEFTEVLDAADGPDDPVDVRISIGYRQEMQWATVARERNTVGTTVRDMIDQDEFDVHYIKHIMDITGRIGLYKDLELHFTIPVHLSETHTGEMSVHWRDKWWAGEYDPSNLHQTGRPSLQTDKVLRYSAWEVTHKGVGDMTFGFTYGVFDEGRDPTRPDVNFTLDFQVPSGGSPQPTIGRDLSNPEKGKASGIGVGSQVFALILKTAAAKSFGIWEPYAELNLHIPFAAGSFIHDPQWQGGGLLGMEFVTYEFKEKQANEPKWRVAFDWRLGIQMFGPGQCYNEITDALAWRKGLDNQDGQTFWPLDSRDGKYYAYPNSEGGVESAITAPSYHLPKSSSYARIHSQFGLNGILGHYFTFSAWGAVGYRTEHFLSVADSIDPETLRPSNTGDYYAQINEVGTRVKLTDALQVSWMVNIGFQY